MRQPLQIRQHQMWARMGDIINKNIACGKAILLSARARLHLKQCSLILPLAFCFILPFRVFAFGLNP